MIDIPPMVLFCADWLFSNFMEGASPGRNFLEVCEKIGLDGIVEEIIAARKTYLKARSD
jgi:hypothetical protein